MFQITRRVDYAVRIMLELGSEPGRARIHARELARRTDVPKAFLHKIVGDLLKAGLVRTYSGPNGGVALAQPATSISMLQIVEAIDGPICLNTCLLRPRECPRDLTCPAHGFWAQLQAGIVQRLQGATLDKLVAERRVLKRSPHRRDIQYLFPDQEVSSEQRK